MRANLTPDVELAARLFDALRRQDFAIGCAVVTRWVAGLAG